MAISISTLLWFAFASVNLVSLGAAETSTLVFPDAPKDVQCAAAVISSVRYHFQTHLQRHIQFSLNVEDVVKNKIKVSY